MVKGRRKRGVDDRPVLMLISTRVAQVLSFGISAQEKQPTDSIGSVVAPHCGEPD